MVSACGEGGATGVTLKDAKEISASGAPVNDSVFIASINIDTLASGLADVKTVNGDSKTFYHMFMYPLTSVLSLQRRNR